MEKSHLSNKKGNGIIVRVIHRATSARRRQYIDGTVTRVPRVEKTETGIFLARALTYENCIHRSFLRFSFQESHDARPYASSGESEERGHLSEVPYEPKYKRFCSYFKKNLRKNISAEFLYIYVYPYICAPK